MNSKKTTKRQLEGVVVSNKMDKTIRVSIDTPYRHPIYKKIMNSRKVVFAHTDKELEIGQKVVLEESRPYSKNIKWIVKEDVTKRN
jgi:small subunit ribosomal protein S17